MECTNLKQLNKIFRNACGFTGAEQAFLSLYSESSNEFETIISDGFPPRKEQTSNMAAFSVILKLNPIGKRASIYTNNYVKTIVEKKAPITSKYSSALENIFSKKVIKELRNSNVTANITTVPIILDNNIVGLISFIYNKKPGQAKIKAMKAFTGHISLFVENMLTNEKLLEELNEKALCLEQEKFNLEQKVKERTSKLDNSRSALLHMLKSIDKARIDLVSSKEYVDNILRSMLEMLIVLNPEGTIQKINIATTNLLGYEEHELIGKPISLIFSDNIICSITDFINDLKINDYISNIENEYIKKDGTHVAVVFSASVMKNSSNEMQGIVCVASDITIRKQQEKEINEKNEKIKKANIELKEALRKAEESDKLKTAFLQNMSHEIRTPLNGIVGFSQLLTSGDLPEDSKLEIAKLVEHSSFRLIELVNNILDIAKIETGQILLNSTAFELNAFMLDIFNFFSLYRKEKNIEITCENYLKDVDSIIISDKEKIHQILVNLINNAVKFTKKGSITFGYIIKNDFIEFFVKDTGIGIIKENQHKIFDRFMQADISVTSNYEGAGLGLAICKGLVDFLGGGIWLDSEPGIGTTFNFTIPYNSINKKPTQPPSTSKNIEKIDKSIKILVAEDDDANYMFLHYLFINSKHRLTRAHNGKEAVDVFRDINDFDLILMDLKMPVMSGYEAIEILKKRFPKIPIIAYTAYAFEDDRQKAFKAGCDDYIQKPFKKEALIEKILKLVEN